MENHHQVMELYASLHRPSPKPLDILSWGHQGLDSWNGYINNYLGLQTLKDDVTISNRKQICDWMLNVCCRKSLTRLLRAIALGKIAECYPEQLVGVPGDGEVIAKEQPSVTEHERWWIEAPCAQKYKISVSCECHASSVRRKAEHGSRLCSLLCAVGLPSANIVLTEPAVRFASVEQI